jgi:hypothetical protein
MIANATERWPNLMAYIDNRNGELQTAAHWCAQLRVDEAAALKGGYADIARELEAAQAAYAESRRTLGKTEYPCNSAMGEFLGLPLGANHEPRHGYYMACQVAEAYRTGEAQRAVAAMIEGRRPLRLVAARDKATRRPVRFHTFTGPEQIKIEGNTVTCTNDKRRVRLFPNWSQSSCLVAVRRAMRTGEHYGASEAAPTV